MKEEVKEILDRKQRSIEHNKAMGLTSIKIQDDEKLLDYITDLQDTIQNKNECIPAYDKIIKNKDKEITNLQEENENLREDNFAYHQLMKMQNKREYRSKFLKDFQKKYGKNVLPDYDEIYKRYDKQKKELEKKDKEIETWKKIAEKLADKLMVLDDGCKHIPTEICNEYSNGRCIQCLIDWARNEVEDE